MCIDGNNINPINTYFRFSQALFDRLRLCCQLLSHALFLCWLMCEQIRVMHTIKRNFNKFAFIRINAMFTHVIMAMAAKKTVKSQHAFLFLLMIAYDCLYEHTMYIL